MINNIYDVIVIGGGVSGLHTGYKLRKDGYKVLILEADKIIGGRCRQDLTFTQFPIELGGEMIHGGDTMFYRMTQEEKWETFEVFSENLFDSPKRSTFFYLGRERKLINHDEIDDDISTLFQSLGEMHQSIDLSNQNDGKDTNLLDFLVKQGVPYRVLGLADSLYSKTWGTTIDRIGLREAVREDDKAHTIMKNFKLVNSNKVLLDHLSKDQSILLNYRVESINYQDSKQIITIQSYDKSQPSLQCKRVVVAVPLTILKENDIKFIPDLPERKRDALSVFGMDSGMKIICKFNRKFWLANCELVICADSPIPQIWMDGAPNRKVPTGKEAEFVVVGFITGDQAVSISALSPLYQIRTMLDQLDAMFGTPQSWNPASSSFISHIVYDWKKNPFIRGAYSYPSVIPNSFKYKESPSHIISEPIDNRVYFAGEHTATKFELSTINGALETGLRVYNEIKLSNSKL